MGEPIGDRYPSARVCTNCWGVGKTFGDTPTPIRVYITWAGLLAPFTGANKSFIGYQSEFSPCVYDFRDYVFEGTWNFGPVNTIAFIKPIGVMLSVTATGGLCSLVCTEPFGGTCTIS